MVEQKEPTGLRAGCGSSPGPAGMAPLVQHAEHTIHRFAMLSEGDSVLIGVSGGPDSLALLHTLCALRPSWRLELAVVHINHGLRGATADQEAAQVQSLTRRLELRLHRARLDMGDHRGSLEERARDARYAIYRNLAAKHGYSRVALGHQADDNAEAVLMNLFRGSGLRGLSGIPPVRQRIIRPLIACRRSQILEYLHDLAVPFAVDASNADLRFERNHIRHELIPLIERHYNPRIVDILNRTAGLCRDEEAFWQEYLRPLTEQVTISENGVQIPIPLLLPLGPPVQRRLLREALRLWRGDLRRISVAHVDAVIDTLLAPRKNTSLRLPNSILAQRTGDRLHFKHAPRRIEPVQAEIPPLRITIASPQALPQSHPIPETGDQLEFRVLRPSLESGWRADDAERAWFDLDQLTFPLQVRWSLPSDRLQPFGMPGHQYVKKLLCDRKLPRAQRQRVPVLVGGDTLLWVVGVRRAAAAPVSGDTLRILQVRRVVNHGGGRVAALMS